MKPPKLRSIPLVQDLALMRQVTEANMRFAGMPRGTLRGRVADIEDPEYRGRVRVIFDDVNKEIPEVYFAGEWSAERIGTEPELSHWIDFSPSFKGWQPPGLLGKRVNVLASNGQYKFACLQDVLYDPEMLATGKKLERPNNSSMTRLPIYPAGELPPACWENHGCIVIEDGGPMDADWLCVCAKRDGEYYWVRHADLSHGHAGGNDGTQAVDSLGNRPNPIMMGTVGDSVFPTTAQQFKQYYSYTTKPQGNPKGQRSHWYPPPMSELEYQEGENFDLLIPQPDIALDIVRSAAGFLDLEAQIAGFLPNFQVEIPLILQEKALSFFDKAQDLLKLAETAKQAISDPLGFVQSASFAAAAGSVAGSVFGANVSAVQGTVSNIQSAAASGQQILQDPATAAASLASQIAQEAGIPPGTDVAFAALQNAAGTLVTSSLEALTPKKTGILGGITSIAKQVSSLVPATKQLVAPITNSSVGKIVSGLAKKVLS